MSAISVPRRRFPSTLLVLVAMLCCPAAALAQGTVVTDRPHRHPRIPGRLVTTPLDLRYQRVYTEITDGVAVTTVTQTFRNPLNTTVEGKYVFPLPEGVSVGDFSMTVGGKTLAGEVLDREKARQTYEEIVRKMRDPGLLEFLGNRLWQSSIAPIPPNQQLDVKLQYSQALSEQGGLGAFVHPLRRPNADDDDVDELVIQVKMKSSLPLTTVFCPSHAAGVSRPSDREATITFEQNHSRADRDFAVYYQRQDAQFGLSLLTHRGAGEPGYFLVRISPRVELSAADIVPKDICFVIDTSGSMQGDKIDQARRALKFCINSLNAKDRFNVLTFSTEVKPFRDALCPADTDIKSAALDFAEKLQAVGGTNINQALAAALAYDSRDSARPYLIVFMTDGQPTLDVTDPNQILKNVDQRNTRDVRFHVFGVGSDVNTHLLDKLAEASRGARDYCTEKEDLELKLSQFVGRLTNPVLTNVKLLFDGLSATDVYPKQLPDLFQGGELLVLGRYDGDGHHAVRFDGRVRGETKAITYEGTFPRIEARHDFLPRLWANRKIAYLLDEIRLRGENRELVTEIVRLATRHGIVTPYTAALIVEDAEQPAAAHAAARPASGGLARRARASKAGEGRAPAEAARGGRASGKDAVTAAKQLRELQAAGYVSDGDDESRDKKRDEPSAIRQIADKTFVFADGRYVDSSWDGKGEPKKIDAYSSEYFALLKSSEAVARYLAIGEHVIVKLGDVVYEIVPAKSEPAEKP